MTVTKLIFTKLTFAQQLFENNSYTNAMIIQQTIQLMMLGHRQIEVISTQTAPIHFADHSILLCTECLRMCPAVLVLLHADRQS